MLEKFKPIITVDKNLNMDSKTQIDEFVSILKANGIGMVNVLYPQNKEFVKKAMKMINYFSMKNLQVFVGVTDTVEKVKKSRDAGAQFLIGATKVDEVESFCRENNIPFFPPAGTEDEIRERAKHYKQIKAFPMGGLDKYPMLIDQETGAIKSEFANLEFLVAGGIKTEHIKSYAPHKQIIIIGSTELVTEVYRNKDISRQQQSRLLEQKLKDTQIML